MCVATRTNRYHCCSSMMWTRSHSICITHFTKVRSWKSEKNQGGSSLIIKNITRCVINAFLCKQNFNTVYHHLCLSLSVHWSFVDIFANGCAWCMHAFVVLWKRSRHVDNLLCYNYLLLLMSILQYVRFELWNQNTSIWKKHACNGNDGEYCRPFNAYCKEHGVKDQNTPLKTP